MSEYPDENLQVAISSNPGQAPVDHETLEQAHILTHATSLEAQAVLSSPIIESQPEDLDDENRPEHIINTHPKTFSDESAQTLAFTIANAKPGEDPLDLDELSYLTDLNPADLSKYLSELATVLPTIQLQLKVSSQNPQIFSIEPLKANETTTALPEISLDIQTAPPEPTNSIIGNAATRLRNALAGTRTSNPTLPSPATEAPKKGSSPTLNTLQVPNTLQDLNAIIRSALNGATVNGNLQIENANNVIARLKILQPSSAQLRISLEHFIVIMTRAIQKANNGKIRAEHLQQLLDGAR